MSDNGESRSALLTDFYQLTMAYGYWKAGKCNDEAVFNLFFRRQPFHGGYAIACGLQQVIEYIKSYHFTDEDLAFLADLQDSANHEIFDPEFLQYLKELRFTCDIDAVQEGTPVFAGEPIVRVKGPLIQCQLLESALLNIINFQTLVATKAARAYVAARGPIFEFGLRRAQGPNGALSASRAAFVGGCSATSNVLAGKRYGIPVKGTHAHSWVMAFSSEAESFDILSHMLPDDCILLVDTYETLEGVENAAKIGEAMKARGIRLSGIRLDSGDIADLSCKSRMILDRHGLIDCRIVASNELDEYEIEKLRKRGAMVDYWGVGTRLVSGHGESALSGVYKMAAIRSPGQEWKYTLKLTDAPEKTTLGGLPRLRRYIVNNLYWGDIIYDEQLGLGEIMVTSDDCKLKIPAEASSEDLLIPIFKGGKLVYESPSLEHMRERTLTELCRLPEELLALTPETRFPVGWDESYVSLNRHLAMKCRGLKKDCQYG